MRGKARDITDHVRVCLYRVTVAIRRLQSHQGWRSKPRDKTSYVEYANPSLLIKCHNHTLAQPS